MDYPAPPGTALEILSGDDVADRLLLRPSTVMDYARRGLIPSVKIGRHRRFIWADVEAAIERLRGS